MSKEIQRLRQLGQLTDAVLLSHQSRLLALAAEEGRIRGLLEELETARDRRAEELKEGPDPAARAGADPRWHIWADGRKESLFRDLAMLRVKREAVRADLALAHGRNEVAGKLFKARTLERAKVLAKKRDHTS